MGVGGGRAWGEGGTEKRGSAYISKQNMSTHNDPRAIHNICDVQDCELVYDSDDIKENMSTCLGSDAG